jgi:protease I
LNDKVIAAVQHFAKTDKPIAAICHGAQLLAAANVIDGKTISAYPAVKPEVLRAGAKWGEVNNTFTNAHVDGNFVTAAAWPAHPEWIRKFLEVLETKITL